MGHGFPNKYYFYKINFVSGIIKISKNLRENFNYILKALIVYFLYRKKN